MAGNVQKTPLAISLPNIANKRSNDLGQQASKSMPVTVTAVNGHLLTLSINVNGDQVQLPPLTVPQTYSQWIREPTQKGDQGFITVPDYYRGGVSGEGGGTADLYPRANLTNAHFQPSSRDSFPMMPDPNAAFINGPNGAVIADMTLACVITLTKTQITIKDSYGHEVYMQNGGVYVDPAGDLLYLGCPPSGAGSAKFIALEGGGFSTKVKAV